MAPMPTSDPGISGKHDFPGRGARDRGFSLLEIMVVVAIIGIFVGVTMLSADLVSFERRMEQEARRLGTLLDFVTDEALLQSQDFGLLICEDGYHFFIYNYDVEDWIPYTAKPFEGYLVDQNMLLTLRLDDAEVVLETTADAYPRNWSLPLAEDELDQMPDPQITILSTGEITPFVIDFLRRTDPLDPGVGLNVAFNGEYEVAFGEE
jgi:general secretion pathway protein H